jgi:FkbM family methyltransferase
MSRMDRLNPGDTARELRTHLSNWWFVGPLSYLIMLSPARHFLEHSQLATREVTLRFRDGRTLRCPINDMQAYVEVFLLRDYDIEGFDWGAAKTIVDAGANIGSATMWFAEQAPAAAIVAVEPGDTARRLLRRNITANGLSARVAILDCALGSVSGRGRVVTGEATILSKIVPLGEGDGDVAGQVTVLSLRDVLESQSIDQVDVLKVDCEGSEYGILMGAGDDVLARVRMITAEYHPSETQGPEDLAECLRGAGFSVQVIAHPTLEGFGNLVALRQSTTN